MDSSSWNSEAADLLENLEATQKEVQALMSQQDASAAKLHELKDEATAELNELQEDAWRMQMFAELQRMKQQLEQLVPLTEAEEAGATGGDGEDWTIATEQEMAAMDEELAALQNQLTAAKQEAQKMLVSRSDMQQVMADMLTQQRGEEAQQLEQKLEGSCHAGSPGARSGQASPVQKLAQLSLTARDAAKAADQVTE